MRYRYRNDDELKDSTLKIDKLKFYKDMFVIKGKNVEQMETISRPSLSFWQDAWRRFRKNRAAFIGLCIILVYVVEDRGVL